MKYGGEASHRPFDKKSKLNISQNQQPEIFRVLTKGLFGAVSGPFPTEFTKAFFLLSSY